MPFLIRNTSLLVLNKLSIGYIVAKFGSICNVCFYRLWLRLLRLWGLSRWLQWSILRWLLSIRRLLFRLRAASATCQRERQAASTGGSPFLMVLKSRFRYWIIITFFSIYMYVCVCVCMYIHICICMYTYIHIYIFSSTCSSLEIVKLFSKRKPVLEIWVLVFNVVARGHRPPSLLEDLENGSRPVRANRFSCFFFSRVIGNCMKPPLNEPTIFASFFSFGTFFVLLFFFSWNIPVLRNTYRSLYIGNWKFSAFELFEIFRRWYYYRFGIFKALIVELYHCYSYAWKVLISFFVIVFPRKRNKLNLATCIGLSDFA